MSDLIKEYITLCDECPYFRKEFKSSTVNSGAWFSYCQNHEKGEEDTIIRIFSVFMNNKSIYPTPIPAWCKFIENCWRQTPMTFIVKMQSQINADCTDNTDKGNV
ncbi:MAG: hypothetical protein V1701_02585 [Planctomycetota bacterium]